MKTLFIWALWRKSTRVLACFCLQFTPYGHVCGIVWSFRQMLQLFSGDISSVKIPLAGLKTSCSQRKLLHETEQRVQPSFSDKGIKHFASVRVCMWDRNSTTQGQPYSEAGWGRLGGGGWRGATIKCSAAGCTHNKNKAQSMLTAIIPLVLPFYALCVRVQLSSTRTGVFWASDITRDVCQAFWLLACRLCRFPSADGAALALLSTEGLFGSSDRSY